MNSNHVCFNCLKDKDELNVYSINGRGYGSIFDGQEIKLQLCDKCKKKLEDQFNCNLEEIFNEKPSRLNYEELYAYEYLIKEIIESLSKAGQKLTYHSEEIEELEMGYKDFITIYNNEIPEYNTKDEKEYDCIWSNQDPHWLAQDKLIECIADMNLTIKEEKVMVKNFNKERIMVGDKVILQSSAIENFKPILTRVEFIDNNLLTLTSKEFGTDWNFTPEMLDDNEFILTFVDHIS